MAGKASPKKPKPSKVCPVCERSFTWRARWKRNWDEVVYCSRRCSSQRWKRRDR
ncbi:DUF2256 domain-containing protein [Pseudohaliea sp.]|uniref:DUF2256 domain-containing protein n=1 Tax=Pseudohaliea sp. TaxID=2740289 RepID=UPI0032EDA319